MADLIITIRIKDAKKAEFRDGFLAICPVPMVNVANPGEPINMQPKMTEKQWVKKVAMHPLEENYKAGKKLLAKQAAALDKNVIE